MDVDVLVLFIDSEGAPTHPDSILLFTVSPRRKTRSKLSYLSRQSFFNTKYLVNYNNRLHADCRLGKYWIISMFTFDSTLFVVKMFGFSQITLSVSDHCPDHCSERCYDYLCRSLSYWFALSPVSHRHFKKAF